MIDMKAPEHTPKETPKCVIQKLIASEIVSMFIQCVMNCAQITNSILICPNTKLGEDTTFIVYMEDRRLGSSNCYFSSKLPMKCASVFNFLSEESFLFEHFVSKSRYHGSCFYPRVCQNEVRVSIRGKYFEHIQISTGPDLVHFGIMLWPPHIRHLGTFSTPILVEN